MEPEEWGWDGESELKSEAELWHSWNGHSPEREFCDFAANLIELVKPMLVLETGTGQGYVTRRTVPKMPEGSRYVCFETNPDLAEQIRFSGEVRVGNLDPTLAGEADLTILDSAGGPVRLKEMRTWWNCAKIGAMVLIHDVSLTHPPATSHYRHAEFVKALRIPGVFLTNPRGSFLGQKQ